MSRRSLMGAGAPRRAARFITATLVLAALGTGGGCLTRPLAPIEPDQTSTVVKPLRTSVVNKIDLLLVVDNSPSMADKQKILSIAVPDLLSPLVNPPCLDNSGAKVANQPTGPLAECPEGSTREFPPVLDIHIGVITSSLGSFGGQDCPDSQGTNNDHGWLISRSDSTNPTNSPVATYQNSGFLAWDPMGQLSPPGESNFDNLKANLQSIVTGAGENGCGFESQNEAWYRFLVDPTPYATIPQGLPAKPQGQDQTLLAQRKAFLRPDSLLAIINVTDETDTSVKAFSGYPEIADKTTNTFLAHARSDCDATTGANEGPTSTCCAPCDENPQPAGCASPDPVCKATPYYDASSDSYFLHAFGLVSHKERYGVDFFYPTDRYVQGLKSQTVTDVNGKSVPNPIYSNLDPAHYTGSVRDPSLVFYAAITGVPWQLISRKTAGVPDLTQGFMNNTELGQSDGQGHTYWDDITGDPDNYIAASSPFMQESLVPRTGTDPYTGTALAAGNTINGGDRPIPKPQGDIEYACIFPIPHRDCTQKGVNCDCTSPEAGDPSQNPLCAVNTNDPNNTPAHPAYTLQVNAKAYPGVRNLAIARGLGDQGIAASICAQTVDGDQTAPAFGYNPAVASIVDRLKVAIGQPCLPLQMPHTASGAVSSCLVLEAVDNGGAACTCNAPARAPVTAQHQPAIVQAQMLDSATKNDCFCEITQVTGAALHSCQNDTAPSNADGWCYIDTTTGNPSLVSQCPVSEQHEVRLVGKGTQAASSVLFVTCEKGG